MSVVVSEQDDAAFRSRVAGTFFHIFCYAALLSAAVIFAFHDRHWLPLVALPAVMSAAAALTYLVTRQRLETLTLMLCVSLYELVGALFLTINDAVFGKPFAQPDSATFLSLISGTFGKIPLVPVFRVNGKGVVDSTLSVFVSQHALSLVEMFQPNPGVWVTITTNTLVLTLGVVLTTLAARQCFRNEAAVRAVALFSAACPLYLLFGIELLRDGYVVAMVSAMLLVTTALVRRFSFSRLIAFAGTMSIAGYLMLFVRIEFIFIPFLITGCAVAAHFFYGRRTHGRALALVVMSGLFMVGLAASIGLLLSLLAAGKAFTTFYQQAGQAGADTSLGYQLVVALPMPLRLLMGSITMHVNPIPLWAFFTTDVMPAFWLRSFNGIWICLLMPLALTGLFSLRNAIFQDKVSQAALLMVALVYVGGMCAIIITTLEIRHLAAFYPAFFIMAGAPFAMGKAIWPLLRSACGWWFGGIIAIHLLWGLLKLFL